MEHDTLSNQLQSIAKTGRISCKNKNITTPITDRNSIIGRSPLEGNPWEKLELPKVTGPHFRIEPDTKKQIDNNFCYHAPKDGQQAKYTSLRSVAKDLAYLIDDLCPASTEKQEAMRKLEEAIMWANASIARNE